LLAFGILTLMALALFVYLAAVQLRAVSRRRRSRIRRAPDRIDPGSERRAERRARALLKSIVNPEEWEMYRDLGFIRVLGESTVGGSTGAVGYGYLIYPHKPIVAYMPGSNSLLSEYCVEFPDRSGSLHGSKLPDSDDMLAKWMMIRADERRLIGDANMHLPGRQVDPQQVRRDLWRLGEWERTRTRARARARAEAADAPEAGPAAAGAA
jgi:hypothetical protein